MKKKKQQHSAAPPPTTNTTNTSNSVDIKSMIHNHALFFDKLIELIPARFYLSQDDGNDSKPWFQGLSKAAKASARQQTKENIIKARRDRLDPEKSHTTTLDLLKQSIETENNTNISKNTDNDGDNDGGNNRSVTYEELQQRLHCKIEELRANRGHGKRSLNEKNENYKKRKRGSEFEESGRDVNLLKSGGDIEKDVMEATKGIEFGKVKIGGGDEVVGSKKRKKGTKAMELERAKRLQEEKRDPEKGEVVAKKHSWKAAVSRAAGEKVHDDPRLLKQSIHKEKKRHEKNVGKWKDRVDSREKVKAEKQQKRAGNIAERINQKKTRKIAKREKKLMRPGFEGRKEGYINGS